jgi:hypothetical protein
LELFLCSRAHKTHSCFVDSFEYLRSLLLTECRWRQRECHPNATLLYIERATFYTHILFA